MFVHGITVFLLEDWRTCIPRISFTVTWSLQTCCCLMKYVQEPKCTWFTFCQDLLTISVSKEWQSLAFFLAKLTKSPGIPLCILPYVKKGKYPISLFFQIIFKELGSSYFKVCVSFMHTDRGIRVKHPETYTRPFAQKGSLFLKRKLENIFWSNFFCLIWVFQANYIRTISNTKRLKMSFQHFGNLYKNWELTLGSSNTPRPKGSVICFKRQFFLFKKCLPAQRPAASLPSPSPTQPEPVLKEYFEVAV